MTAHSENNPPDYRILLLLIFSIGLIIYGIYTVWY